MFLGACGFQPLYSNRPTGGGAREFSKIRIEPIKDRVGQILHNHLLTALNPNGPPQNPLFSMTVTVSESSSSLGVRKSAFATRANLNVSAAFKLSDFETRKGVFSQTSRITVSYNILDSDFATLSAKKDARARALREISEDIRVRLGVYFTQAQSFPKK
ncbi:MAG: hypothetical protein HQ512_15435 [Rhodospirillales bacterium]|nr:hypothetical protein [Rhodospirillales bacterium]